MVIISPPFTSFIMAGFLLVFLSFPLMLIEASAIRNFQPSWWYTKGPVVMRRRYFLPTPSPLREVLGAVIGGARSGYDVVDDTTCLFHRRLLFPGTPRIWLKGRLRVQSGEIVIESRAPLALCVSLIGFLLILGGVGLGANDPLEGWGMAILFLVPLTLILGVNLSMELHRFHTIAAALAEAFNAFWVPV
jgi:hypothetical protein